MHISSKYLAGFLLLSLMLVGCASAPEATYTTYDTTQNARGEANIKSGKNQEGSIKFFLQGSVLTLAIAAPKSTTEPGAKPPAGKIGGTTAGPTERTTTTAAGMLNAVTAAPTPVSNVETLQKVGASVIVTASEDKRFLFGLNPVESIWFKPNVSVTYFDNSRMIKVIGTDAQDDRIKVIQGIGGALASLITVAAGAPAKKVEVTATDAAPLSLPVAIDISSYDFGASAWVGIQGNPGWEYKVSLQVDPRGTKQRDDFFSSFADKSTRAFPLSSCQDGDLQIRKSKGTNANEDRAVSYPIRIADPRNVETMLLPYKGSITMHTICGADLATQKVDKPTTDLDVMQEIITQIGAIQKAQKAKPATPAK
jgi:hypothetical protein